MGYKDKAPPAISLRVGKIPYLNLYPIFRALEARSPEVQYIEGVPSALNRMLRNGVLDVSPSSSIEYLRDPGGYKLIKGHCIGSSGPVGSILLFSTVPIEELQGREVAVTYESETSAAMLEIVLRKFYKMEFKPFKTNESAAKNIKAGLPHLAIGDDALLTAGGAETLEQQGTACRRILLGGQELYEYDLGALWEKFESKPFVYALWIAGTGLSKEKSEALARFARELEAATEEAMDNLEAYARDAARPGMSTGEVLDYWRSITYVLGDGEMAGLKAFGTYCEELGLLMAE